MPEITITLNDSLQDRVDSATEDIKTNLLEYLKENEPSSCPDWDDLDNYCNLHEIIDSSVPIYTREIETAWFLHGNELESAYSDAGVGENPRENDGMVAIYFYIDQQARQWFDNNAEDIFETWEEEQKAKEAKEEEN